MALLLTILHILPLLIISTISQSVTVELYAHGFEQPSTHKWYSIIAINNGLNLAKPADVHHPIGHTIVLINETTGTLMDVIRFDTYYNSSADAHMLDYLTSITSIHTIVAIVTFDAVRYSSSTHALLQTWGCNEPEPARRESFLFIGTPSVTYNPSWQNCALAAIDATPPYVYLSIPLFQTSNSTTQNPTTNVPTTNHPTTIQPTTDTPTTSVPTSASPTTTVPTSITPTTDIPTTSVPTSASPTTQVPTTYNPTTKVPTTTHPTVFPSVIPTVSPSVNPTESPLFTPNPTSFPTVYPTLNPTLSPSLNPTNVPTTFPSVNPTSFPTPNPTPNPTLFPTDSPTLNPSESSTQNPTESLLETLNPTVFPTVFPSIRPTSNPVLITIAPTINPTMHTPNPTKIDDGQCSIGAKCMNTYECCDIGANMEYMKRTKGVICACKYTNGYREKMWGMTCEYKQCCLKNGHNGCDRDSDCCHSAAMCYYGKCIAPDKHIQYYALVNGKESDNLVPKTFANTTSNMNGTFEWTLLGFCGYWIVVILLYVLYKLYKNQQNSDLDKILKEVTNATLSYNDDM